MLPTPRPVPARTVPTGTIDTGTAAQALRALLKARPDLDTQVRDLSCHRQHAAPHLTALLTGACLATGIPARREELEALAAEAVRRSAGKTPSVTWSHEGQTEASLVKQLQDMEHQANPMALWQRICLETSLTKPEITYLIAGHVLALGYPRHIDVWGEISGLSFVARHPQEGTLRAQVSRDTAR